MMNTFTVKFWRNFNEAVVWASLMFEVVANVKHCPIFEAMRVCPETKSNSYVRS